MGLVRRGMKGEGKGWHSVGPDGLGRVLSVSATRRGFLMGRSAGDGRDQRADCSRRHAGASLLGVGQGSARGRVVRRTVRHRRCDQEGSGKARSLARARLNWFCRGQPWGRCRVRRRAEWVSRPAIEHKRRRRVLVVTSCSPRPSRAVHGPATVLAVRKDGQFRRDTNHAM